MKKTKEYKNIDEHILIFAFRYALNRKTGAVGIVADMIRENWELLEEHTQEQIKYEIRNRKEMGGLDQEQGNYYVIHYWNDILRLK